MKDIYHNHHKEIIFLASDASFKADNSAILAVKDYFDNNHYQKIVKQVSGSLEAEEQALRFAIDIAITKGYKHVVFIYDCQSIKTDKFFKRYSSNFTTMQMLWIPRDHISSVDKLTKKHFSDSEMEIMHKSAEERDAIVFEAFSKIPLTDKESFFLELLSGIELETKVNSERTIILSTIYILLSNSSKKRMKRFLKEHLESEELNKVFKRKKRKDYLGAINFYKVPYKDVLVDLLKIYKVL